MVKSGAGEGDRTLVCSLGSYRSTIELHPLGVECDAHSSTGIYDDYDQT